VVSSDELDEAWHLVGITESLHILEHKMPALLHTNTTKRHRYTRRHERMALHSTSMLSLAVLTLSLMLTFFTATKRFSLCRNPLMTCSVKHASVLPPSQVMHAHQRTRLDLRCHWHRIQACGLE
jgi:hypothetical protein